MSLSATLFVPLWHRKSHRLSRHGTLASASHSTAGLRRYVWRGRNASKRHMETATRLCEWLQARPVLRGCAHIATSAVVQVAVAHGLCFAPLWLSSQKFERAPARLHLVNETDGVAHLWEQLGALYCESRSSWHTALGTSDRAAAVLRCTALTATVCGTPQRTATGLWPSARGQCGNSIGDSTVVR